MENPIPFFVDEPLTAGGDEISGVMTCAGFSKMIASIKVTGSESTTIGFYTRIGKDENFDNLTPFAVEANKNLGQFSYVIDLEGLRHSIVCKASNNDLTNAGTVTVKAVFKK